MAVVFTRSLRLKLFMQDGDLVDRPEKIHSFTEAAGEDSVTDAERRAQQKLESAKTLAFMAGVNVTGQGGTVQEAIQAAKAAAGQAEECTLQPQI